MGKTNSIKERRVDVYLDTLDRKERWTELASEHGDSLSKFVQKAVEYAIEKGGPDFAELGGRAQRIQALEAEVKDLRKELNQKEIVIEKLEDDLRKYRSKPFLEDDFEGFRQYDRELIEILQSAEKVSGGELRRRLDIDPTDTELMQGLDRQLQQLDSYGLVSHTANGWRWTG